MKLKTFFACFCLILCASKLTAQQTLNLFTTSQGVVRIAFDEQPKLTFETPEVLTVTSTSMTVEFPFTEVEKITFDDLTDGVGKLTIDDDIRAISIFDLSGKLVRQQQAVKGAASVDLSTLRPGVYVIKDGKRTYKIIKPSSPQTR